MLDQSTSNGASNPPVSTPLKDQETCLACYPGVQQAFFCLFVYLFYSFSITTTALPLNLNELYAVCQTNTYKTFCIP